MVTQRGTLGQVGIVPEVGFDRFVISQSQMRLRCDPARADSLYVYYWLLHPETVRYILANAVASGVPHINLGFFRGMRLPLPPVREQRAIASILSALDDKIDLNRRLNETLEELARSIFKSWFIDFDPVRAKAEGRQPVGMDAETAKLFPGNLVESELGLSPRGWEAKPVRDLVESVYDGPHATPPESETGRVYLGIKNFATTHLDFGERRLIDDEHWAEWTKRVTPRGGDIVFTYEATLGHFAVIPDWLTCCLGRRTALVRPVDGHLDGLFVYHQFVSAPFQAFLRAHIHPGSTVDRILLTDFPGYPLLWPGLELARRFHAVVEPLWNRFFANVQESRTLSTLRDTLLPKLISGELRIKDAEKLAEAVL